ncbi:MAG: hypothetical protein H0T89_35315 [Deltaproteobacteria bacterium]|nr:hypothetical protein [Deltaproteobacteria bacterium]MDQ3298459.1 Kazal-type serine protease inhibitor [Myxococcota bacterium]
MFAAAALAACDGVAKEDAKGQVDESQPPAIPTELGKADDASKTIATNVQSPHPYANGVNKVFPVSLAALPSCAKTARLHFKVLRTERDYDFVTVEPVNAPVNEPFEDFTGDRDDTWSGWFGIHAPSVNVRLESDSSITRHGFEIDKIEWAGTPANCPAVATTCAAGRVNLAKRPGTCECPAAAICEPIANLEVWHQLARGFNNTTKRANGPVATFTHPGPADGPETDTVGSVDTVRLAAIVRRAAELGLLQGAGYNKPVAAGTFYDRLGIKAGAYEVSFLAGQGTHTPEVQNLINDFEALFTCEGTGGLTCGTGYTCEDGSCIVDQGCFCPAVYAPVCGTGGQTFSNGCAAACANAAVVHDGECGIPGDTCGTMLGLPCAADNKCRYQASTFTAPWPDAGGTCVAPNYCDAPADCNGLPHIAVPGAWACQANQCAWTTGSTWKPVTNGHFQTASPYANNTSVWHQLYLPAEAQLLRLSATRFRTEAGYDKLEVWTWKNGAWTLVRMYSGTAGPRLTDEFPGVYHYLRFVSDSSVTDQGVSVDAQWR